MFYIIWTRSARPTLPPPLLFIIWLQLEGGFDGNFARISQRSICEIEINSPRQKVETEKNLFKFRAARISIRTFHEWETLHGIWMSQIHIFEMQKSTCIFNFWDNIEREDNSICQYHLVLWSYQQWALRPLFGQGVAYILKYCLLWFLEWWKWR